MIEGQPHQPDILRMIHSWSNATAVAFTSVNEAANKFDHLILSQYSPTIEAFSTPWVPGTCCLRVMERNVPLVICSNSDAPPELGCPMMQAEGFEAYLGVPVLLGQQPFGALEMMNAEPRNWTKQEVAQMEEYAAVYATILKETKTAPNPGLSH